MSERMALMEQVRSTVTTHACPTCTAPTYCAIEAGKSSSTCWCMAVPRRDNPDITFNVGDRCNCRRCLAKD